MAARPTGFTLIEVLVAVAIAGTLATIAWPSMQGRIVKARRADAAAALQHVQIAQERHHALHGLYANDLGMLGAAPRSPEGLYRIQLQPGTGADTYTAVAVALAGSSQAGDGVCTELTLRVDQGFAQLGPNLRCWNR